MYQKQAKPNNSFFQKIQLGLQPAPAWSAIFALTLFTLLGLGFGGSKILNLAFPLAAFAVGLLLYFSYPVLYCGFAWWILFLTPLIRRLADYRSGYTEPSPLLLAPYLVLGITLVTVARYLPRIHLQGGFPFLITFASILYGGLIGVINRDLYSVARGLLDWISPVAFAFHLFINWRDYPRYRENIYRVFVWGVLLMGLYGIYQFVTVPAWDRLWVVESRMVTSQGLPEPFSMRVWSTMNSGEPFAAVMTAGLLLLLTEKGNLGKLASIAGYLSLLLTTVRSAWLGWLAGILTLTGSLKPKHQIRLILIILVLGLAIIPLATIEPFSETINSRLSTFSDLDNDGSALARKETFQLLIDSAMSKFLGDGIGGILYDNTFLALLFNLGWFASFFYMGGLFLLLLTLFVDPAGDLDPFKGATRAIVISAIVRLPVNGPIVGASGVALWAFLALGIACQKYYHQQKNL